MKQVRSILLALGVFMLFSLTSQGQVVYQDIYKTGIYDFLDEMANQQHIELTTFSRPYSRKLIAEKLAEINSDKLNPRQRKELEFFLKDFNKELNMDKSFKKRYDLFYYRDSLFMFSVNPVLGSTYQTNENNTNLRRTVGGELFGTIGSSLGFYVNLRDNTEKVRMQNDTFLNTSPGEVHKGSGDFSTIRGGITYSWDWGSLRLLKDRFSWGNNNFGANIFSDKAPSFARMELKVNPVKWLEFTYFHGWLASEVRDTSRGYPAGARQRNIDVNKFMAANAFTIKPLKGLHITLGNSIVYSDNIQPAFFIPFMFFKPIDHVVYSGGGNYGGANSQMFMDISSRNIKNLQLYTSLFIDEISITRMWKNKEHSNFISWKIGAEWTNILNKNLELFTEYTRTNPITYRHFVNTTTFESNQYNMGHYLRDNAQELALGLGFRPLSRIRIYASCIWAEKGIDYPYLGTNTASWGLPFMQSIRWNSTAFNSSVTYEWINDLLFDISYQFRSVRGTDQAIYTHPMFQGRTHTLRLGIHIGF